MIILIACLLLAIVAIRPSPWVEGVAINSVKFNSSANLAGIVNPKAKSTPLSKEIITYINNEPVRNLDDYTRLTTNIALNRTYYIKTNQGTYSLTTKPLTQTIELNETKTINVPKTIQVNETINGTTVLINKTINETKTVPKTETKILGIEDLGLKVGEAPQNNLRQGLDLAGGTRVLLKAVEEATSEDMDIAIENLKQRLNVFGLSDVQIRSASDLSGNQYILIEMAGVIEEEVRELLAQQGKFEAKIGDNVVFVGGQKDITYVCRSAECSGIDPQRPCPYRLEDGSYGCSFFFGVSLSEESAQRMAESTKDLEIVTGDQGDQYLSQDLELYLDDKLVDTLKIGSEIKGRKLTSVQVRGGGTGTNEQEAVTRTFDSMKKLRTVLITGSLPVKLDIVKIDTVSPLLGKEFLNNAILIGALAILSVVIVISIRYKKIKIAAPMAIAMVSEVILVMGFAAAVGWNLDLAALAGVIIAIGTGVDDLIVITDETISKGQSLEAYNWKKKLKRAFFIIMAAYFTTLAGMIPLWFAGAGLLKGFVFTTIVGISFGVFIARPAYAAMIENLTKE